MKPVTKADAKEIARAIARIKRSGRDTARKGEAANAGR